jgi:hypothetical protein
VEWSAVGAVSDSVSLIVSRGDSVALDTTAAVPESGRLETPALPPGRYAWRGRVGVDGREVSGGFDVEAWTPELLHPRASGLERSADEAAGARPEAAGRRLRTHPLPWLLILGLLSAEWIFRRRRGLR